MVRVVGPPRYGPPTLTTANRRPAAGHAIGWVATRPRHGQGPRGMGFVPRAQSTNVHPVHLESRRWRARVPRWRRRVLLAGPPGHGVVVQAGQMRLVDGLLWGPKATRGSSARHRPIGLRPRSVAGVGRVLPQRLLVAAEGRSRCCPRPVPLLGPVSELLAEPADAFCSGSLAKSHRRRRTR